MQAILNYFTAPVSLPVRDDGRDKWVGIVSALGIAVLLASDVVSLLWR